MIDLNIPIGVARIYHTRTGHGIAIARTASDCWSVEVFRTIESAARAIVTPGPADRPIMAYSRVWDGTLSDLPIGMTGRDACAEYVQTLATTTFDGLVPDVAAALNDSTNDRPEPMSDDNAEAINNADTAIVKHMSEPARRALLAADPDGRIDRAFVPLGVLRSLADRYHLAETLHECYGKPYRISAVRLNKTGRRLAVRLIVNGLDG